MPKDKKVSKEWCVKAYCSTCGKLLMTSSHFTRKELIQRWDAAVVGAAGIPCEDCKHTIPNFSIKLRICDVSSNREYIPSSIIPKPKYDITDSFQLTPEMLVKMKSYLDKRKEFKERNSKEPNGSVSPN